MAIRKQNACVDRLSWVVCKTLLARDPAPNDPDVLPIREPEPEPDSPEPEPGDEPERIDPVHVHTDRNWLPAGA